MTLPLLALAHALNLAVHVDHGCWFAREVSGADLALGMNSDEALAKLARIAVRCGVGGEA